MPAPKAEFARAHPAVVAGRKPGRPRDPGLEARRRREILTVAATVFAGTGYAETDVQAIADRVGVGKGTVYRYFPTKKGLFLAAVDQGLRELAAEIDAVVLDESREPLDRFAGAVRAYLAYFAARPEMAELFVQERAAFRDRHQPLYFAMQSEGACEAEDHFLGGLLASGVLRPLGLEPLRDVLSDLLYGTIMANSFSGRRVSPRKQADDLLDIVFHGILGDPPNRAEAAAPPKSPRKARRMPRVVLPLLLALALPACAPKDAAPTAATPAPLPTVTVTTATVTSRSVQRSVAVVGTLTGYDEVLLSPKVDGRVLKVHRDVGDRVYPGDVVLELDPVDLQLELDGARLALQAELARLGLTALPAGELLVEGVPSVARAVLVLDNARSEQKRLEGLSASGSVSKRELDLVVLDLKTAEVGKRDAVTQALATLAAARLKQSLVETAEQHLKDTKIAAPVPGVYGAWAAAVGPAFVPLTFAVGGRMVTEGEVVRSNPVTNLFRLVLDHALKLRSPVPEQFSGEVRVGQAVELTVDAYPGRPFRGQVTRINPTIDPQTRTFLVEVSVPNLDGKLKSGGFSRALIATRTEEARTIPPQALVTFAGVNKVFTVAGDKAHAVEVKLGARGKDWIEVFGELPPGTALATSGFSQLVEGSPVTLRK